MNMESVALTGLKEVIKQKLLKLLKKYPPPPHFWKQINLHWLRGFTQGDGGFHVNFVKRKKTVEIICTYQVAQHERSIYTLLGARALLGSGTIPNCRDQYNYYREKGYKNLQYKIFKQFINFGFFGQKHSDFLFCKAIVECTNLGLHRQTHILIDLIKTTLRREKLQLFKNNEQDLIKHIQENSEKQISDFQSQFCWKKQIIPWFGSTLNEQFVTGLTDSDGTFSIKLYAESKVWPTVSVRLFAGIYSETQNLNMLTQINTQYFSGLGKIYHIKNSPLSYISFAKFKTLDQVVIPFFLQNPLLSSKYYDFEKFVEVACLIKAKKHKTIEGMKKIIEIAYQSNSGKNGQKSLRMCNQKQYIDYLNCCPTKDSFYALRDQLPELKREIMSLRNETKM